MNAADQLRLGIGRRLPMILQTEAAECGLACIAMIAGYYGFAANPAELRRRFNLSLKGATLKHIVAIADQLGLASRPLRIEMHELASLQTPCILHWDLNHFVVLQGVKGGRAIIHDPAIGMRRMPLDEVSRHFTGVAAELTPTGGFEPAAAQPRVRIRALLGHLVGVRRALGKLLVLALAIELFALVSPLFIAWVVDHAIVTADRSLLLTLVIGFSLLLLMHGAVAAMRGWMLMGLGASLKVQARANLFSHLINLPPSYFGTRHMGDVMSRFGSQETILKAITADLVIALLDGLMCILTLILMFVFAPALSWIVLAGAALYAALRWALYGRLRQANSEAIIWAARRDTHFLETLRGITAIKLFNAQENRRSHWLNLLVETTNRQLTTQKLDLLFRIANMILLGGLTIVIVWMGALRVLDGIFSVGLLIAFLAYKDMFLKRSSELINRIVDLQMLRLHAERLGDIALTAPEPRGLAVDRRAALRPVSIEVRDVWFRYGSNDAWALQDLSFSVAAGEAVAITGPSGCGKTTLLRLLAGLLEPTRGSIFINGEPLSPARLDSHRAMTGVVMQDDQLFAGSIADNICFFSGQPDHRRIKECASAAAVHSDIMAMPMGYATLIGDMGTVLSGGQKQRVLIARALYRRPTLLLLDEATSNLDIDNEAAVNAAVRARRLTRIVIAHRPDTIRAYERVIRMNGGRVTEDGRAPSFDAPALGDAIA